MTDADRRALERAVRVNAGITTALIVLIVATVVGGGLVAYRRTRQALEPDRVAAEAEAYLKAHYPGWRAELKQELVRGAPKVAERLSRRAVKSIPEARAAVERQLAVAVDRGLDEAEDVGEDQLRDFVRRHKDDIRRGYADLKASPAEARAAVARVEAAAEREFGADLQAQAGDALGWLRSLNARLRDAASADPPATASAAAGRRMIRLVKAVEVRGEALTGR